MTLQCPANFLHFLQSENIGSTDGDPITLKLKLMVMRSCAGIVTEIVVVLLYMYIKA